MPFRGAVFMLLGAHCSIAGGFWEAAKEGRRIKCEAFQIFSRSPRALRKTKPITPEEAERFKDTIRVVPYPIPYIHANYLINLSAAKAQMLKVARTAFVEELERAQTLGIAYVVFHPGAHMGNGEAWALKRISESLDWCLSKADAPRVRAVLENTAGQGSTVGYTWEQLREIIESSSFEDRLGVCVDTCHALAAGYDFLEPDRYEAFVKQIDAVLGLKRLDAFHLNDSKQGVGSRVDRHEHIGKGAIGEHPFRRLVNDYRFTELPGILETPGQYKRNLTLLKSIRKP